MTREEKIKAKTNGTLTLGTWIQIWPTFSPAPRR